MSGRKSRATSKAVEKPPAAEKAKPKPTKKPASSGGVTKKASSSAKSAKSAASKHPSFEKMVTASLKELANESDSTLFSIKKITDKIAEKYPSVDVNGGSYKRWLNGALNAGVDDKRFIQVRKSYRVSAKVLNAKRKSRSRSRSPVKAAPKKRAASKSRSKSPVAKKAKTSTSKSRSKSPAKKETKSRSKSPAKKSKKAAKEVDVEAEPAVEKEKPKRKAAAKEKAEKPAKPAPKPKAKGKAKAKADAAEKPSKKEKAPPRKLLLLRKSSSLVGSFVEPPAAPEQRFAVAFNTTDLANVRESLREEIKGLLDAGVSIGLVANRGYLAGGNFNLERTDFSQNADDIIDIINNAFGEGADWAKYYKEVLQSAAQLPWEGYTSKTLVLVGSEEGVATLIGEGLQHEVQALNTKGVNVFAFNHDQLALLADVVKSLK